jgi:elongation factor 1-beta
MSKPTDVLEKAKALEGKLKGNLFLGGNLPTAADVQAFNDLLGEKNTNVYRWVKHVASFTEAERSAWGAPGKKLAVSEGKKEEAKPAAAAAPKKEEAKPAAPAAAAKAAPKPAAAEEEFDMFAEETDEEQQARMAKKLADIEAKKGKKEKAAVIAKSSILLDVKTWDDTVDLEALALKIKSNVRDGLMWGAHKQAPVAFGVKKLQLLFVIEDDKVSSEDIEEIIMQYEEEVQSMDVVAWNKV